MASEEIRIRLSLHNHAAVCVSMNSAVKPEVLAFTPGIDGNPFFRYTIQQTAGTAV